MASFKKGAEAAGVEQPDLGPAGDAAMEKGMEVAEEKLEEEFNKAIDKAISNHETNDAAMY